MNEDFSHILEKYGGVRQALASGELSIDEEVKIRAQLATILVQNADQTGQKYLIDGAVQHMDTVLRRLPRDSPDRPKHLSRLSYIKISEYSITNSRRALNDAVLNGRRARDMAVATDLLHRDSFEYFDVLNNFGYALSQRFALLQDAVDLEDAIACARETHEKAEKGSLPYVRNLNNLASRLRLRYNQNSDESDINQALSLINELQSKTTPGTQEYAMAAAQLGVMGSDKFDRTNKLEDLDEALKYSIASLNTLHGGFESRVPMLRMIAKLYRSRFEKTSEKADFENAVRYGANLFHNVPRDHTARGRFLLNYLRDMYNMSTKFPTLSVIQEKIRAAQSAIDDMPIKYPEKRDCQRTLADLLFEQYSLTCNLQDLLTFVSSAEKITNDYNNEVDHGDPTTATVDTIWLWNLRKYIQVISGARLDNVMRSLSEREISDQLQKSRQAFMGSSVHGLEHFYHVYGLRLQVLAEAIEGERILPIEKIDEEITKLKEKKEDAVRERQARPRFPRDDYKTEFGLRKLAMDEEGNMILDMSGLMSDILGYDVTKKYSAEELASLNAKSEQESLDEARLKGRHPNLSLCRMCRDFAKVLQPTSKGFELTAEHAVLPFGNFFQLRQRTNCSICSLVLSLITTRAGALHPYLAAIDPEVQGVRLSSGRLSTNEKVLRVDYGMKHVGEIRILTPQNRFQALRQAHEIDAQFVLWKPSDTRRKEIEQRINLDIVKSWLNNCDHNHGSACNHPRSQKRAANSMPLNFIDVQNQRLVSATSDEKYFALSYTWGRVDMFQTLKSNFDVRKQSGSLATIQFPKTIKDAMSFVLSLGERYLWVDAICLVQDDQAQMSRDVPNMDIVYGQAFATLAALGGTDANAGLAGVREGSRDPQKITTLTISDRSQDLDDDPDSKEKETVRLVATPRPLYLSLKLSQWDTRGWILQEHLLSRRCLYFAPDAIYFQCGEETSSEGGCNERYEAHLMDKDHLGDGFIIEKENRVNPIFGLDLVYDLPPRQRLTKVFHAYTKLVGLYSQRTLSYKSDVLKAFAGMFAVLEEHFQSTTIHGLPAAVLSHALLWSPSARLPRRGSELPTGLRPISNPDPQFPSWSWVGWDGPVEYRLFHEAKGEMLLPVPQVEVYETMDGPIRDAITTQKGTAVPPNAAVNTEEEIPPEKNEDQSPETTGTPDKDDPSKGRVIAKMVPDNVRQSTWVISAPMAPSERNDPYITTKLLRFTARTVPVPAFQISPTKEYLSSSSRRHIRSSQAVRRIRDRNGKHCGLWWEQAGYGYVGLGISPEAESKIDMLEISRYGDAQRPRDGPYLVEGPISLFDDEVFPSVGPNSELVNVLVVDLDMGLPDGIGERCTVAVIHVAAWEAANPREKEVRMV
ncbi:hypothetical protein N0V90_011393 [Kalmusia sp. IMI 367209]|nr:hypothetical protein N0V90_011393 [Kalmusia sp. IMI 367209]